MPPTPGDASPPSWADRIVPWRETVRRAGDVVDRHPGYSRPWFYAALVALAVIEVALVALVVLGLTEAFGYDAELALPAAVAAVLLPIAVAWATRSAASGEVGAFGRTVEDVRRGRWPGDPPSGRGGRARPG
jgi:hypothetical protein